MDANNPSEIQSALFNQWLFTAVVAVVSLISGIVSVWQATRRQPPVDRDLDALRQELIKRPTFDHCTAKHQRLAADKATQEEVARASHDREHTELRKHMDDGTRQFMQIERTLGRIESGMETLRSDVSSLRSELSDIRGG